jgi:hypothetical protein
VGDLIVVEGKLGERGKQRVSLTTIRSFSYLQQDINNSQDHIVLAQPPNPPLLVAIPATLLKLIVTSGNIPTGLDAVVFGCLFTCYCSLSKP